MTHVQSSILIETSHQRRKEGIWSVSNLSGRIIMTTKSSLDVLQVFKKQQMSAIEGPFCPTDDDDQTN